MNGPLDAAPASAPDEPGSPPAPGGRDASRSCLEVTLRHISDAVIVSDGQGLVTLMNPLAEALTGWSGFEASGQRLAHVFPVVSDLTGEPLCLAPTRPDEAAPDWTPLQLIDRQGKRHPVSVRCAVAPAGNCTRVIRLPWSSSGRKEVGMRTYIQPTAPTMMA